jgi:hypothetical protein
MILNYSYTPCVLPFHAVFHVWFRGFAAALVLFGGARPRPEPLPSFLVSGSLVLGFFGSVLLVSRLWRPGRAPLASHRGLVLQSSLVVSVDLNKLSSFKSTETTFAIESRPSANPDHRPRGGTIPPCPLPPEPLPPYRSAGRAVAG